MAKFPHRIYARRELSDNEIFLVADEDITTMVGVGDKEKVAIYSLVEVNEIEGAVINSGTKKRLS
jgi:hypothetical protein